MIKLSDYVIKFLSTLNIKHVFLLPGGGCMHLVDSLGNSPLIPVCFLHEQAATIAAEAYSQYNENIGVVLVTTGPGGTNTITGVAGAFIDSIPLLIISGQAKTTDLINDSGVRQMGIQEVDIVSIVKPITKYAFIVREPKNIRYHLEKAIHIAKSGRPGPVWLDIPLDVQGALIDETSLPPLTPCIQSPLDISSQIHDTIQLINKSKKPVILVGNGVRLSHATSQFIQLIEQLQIPILTTWKTVDFLSETHPLYFGRPGSISSRYANIIQQSSDLIITLGTRLDLTQVGFNYPNFAPHAKKVIVDIDQNEISKVANRTKVDIPICTDAKHFINQLLSSIHKININTTQWLFHCTSLKNKYPIITPNHSTSQHLINPYALIDTLSSLLLPSDIIIPGSSGSCAELTLQAFRIKQGQRLFNTPGLGSMGYGLPASIGACIASNRRTISIIGDGGLQHNIQELETLRRLNLPIKIFIMNNNGYNSIRTTQNKHFAGHHVCCDPSSGLSLPDTCSIATAYNLPTSRIKNQHDLTYQIQQVLNSRGPHICEVMIDPSIETLPKLSSRVLPDGSIISSPLEDLYPFLSPEELTSALNTMS